MFYDKIMLYLHRSYIMIPFNKHTITQLEKDLVMQSLDNDKICGDGIFTKKVNELINQKFGIKNFLLTTSCSSALDLSAIILDLKSGDEVIMPSFTFVSTANAVVLRGAKPIFCDIKKENLNIDETKIEALITPRTKAIYVVHYAGQICEMDKIMKIAKKYNLYIVEDAAQAIGSKYKGKYAGTIGDIGCYSFHDTKNYTSGEGGAIIINNESFLSRAEIIREKGTNRSQFLRGEVDKYTWQDVGSSFLPSDLLSALLYAQLNRFDEIFEKRCAIWSKYYKNLLDLDKQGKIVLQPNTLYTSNKNTFSNAHIFYFLCKSEDERNALIQYLKQKGVQSTSHFEPLHCSPMYRRLRGSLPPPKLTNTENCAKQIIRLPMFYDLKDDEIEYIIKLIKEFYNK